MLPVQVETDRYSFTNTGRFSLLGRETKWCLNTNMAISGKFLLATLVQHLLVPQDKDCICPFTPIELGGDGSYYPTASVWESFVRKKANDFDEVVYRINSLMTNTWGFRFVHSERLNTVVHKYHLLVPKVEQLRNLIPPEAIRVPENDESKALMHSMLRGPYETPGRTLFRLMNAAYWRDILRGKEPVAINFNVERTFDPSTANRRQERMARDLDAQGFLEAWSGPGFKFKDYEPYYVLSDAVKSEDYLSLKWDFVPFDDATRRHLNTEFENWLRDNLSLYDRALPDVLRYIDRQGDMPQIVKARMNLFFESDSYILDSLPSEFPRQIGIVTGDVRLAEQVYRIATRDSNPHEVVCIHPRVYLVGRYFEAVGQSPGNWSHPVRDDMLIIEDQGAMLHVDYTEFKDGVHFYDAPYFRRGVETPDEISIWTRPIKVRAHYRNERIYIVD